MASKVKRGFLYYLLWLLFIVFGVLCIFLCILIFNPGKDVFGINLRYISDYAAEKADDLITYNGNEMLIKDAFKQGGLDTIVINSNNADISVKRTAQHEQVVIKVNKKMVGLCNSDHTTFDLSKTIEGSSLIISTNEPDFWLALSNQVSVSLEIPNNSAFDSFVHNLKIKTNGGAVSLGSTDLSPATFKDVNIETVSGGISLLQKLETTSGNFELKTKTGLIDVYNDVKGTLKIESTQSSKIQIGNISGNVDIDAFELSVKCGDVGGNFTFFGRKGNISANNIAGNLVAEEYQGNEEGLKKVNLTIKKVGGFVTIPTGYSSDVVINEVLGNVSIDCADGNVTLKKCSGWVEVTTTSGAIMVTQLNANNATLKSYNGKITANLLAVGNNVNLSSTKGNINIHVANNLHFNFDYSFGKDIGIYWIEGAIENNKVILAPGTPAGTPNTIVARTTNSIMLFGGYELPTEE